MPIYCVDYDLFCTTERKVEMFLADYYKSHTNPSTKVKFPSIENLYKYHSLCFIDSIVNCNYVPSDIKSLFNVKARERVSKFSHHFIVPAFTKTAFKKSFQYRGIKLWNEQDKKDVLFRSHVEFKSRQRIKFNISDD